MKRFTITVAIVLVVVLFSGCSILTGVLSKAIHHSTDVAGQSSEDITIEATPTLEAETAEPSEEPAPTANVYTSTALGITFTLPDSWTGKYRVQEGDGYLSVYFTPASTIEDGMGKFFTMIKKTSDDDGGFFDNEQEIEINGTTYIWGMPTDVSYSEANPEYDTYVAMQKDLPGIVQSIKAAE